PCKDLVPHPTELKKIGDMRYNYIYWVGENQAASPLGYGPSAGDPETGQLVWGTAYIYGAPTLTYGQASMDLVDLVNGNIDPKDVVSGEYIRKWILEKGDVLPSDNSATLFEGGLRTEKSDNVALTRINHAQFDDAGIVQPATDPFLNPDIMKFLNDKQMQRELYSTIPTVEHSHTQHRADAIRGTTLEDMMITEEVRVGLTGKLDAANLSSDMREKLSPASWATGGHASEILNAGRNKALSQVPCSFERHFMDDSIYGIAKEFFCSDAEKAAYLADKDGAPKKCLTGDDLRWEITTRILSGLTEHEVGHTVGLRHNFSGSVDLFNFHDEYFDIKKPEQIYCKADGHCDDDLGESCTYTACNATTSCPDGLTCDGGKCMDGSDTETGLCAVGGTPVERLAPRPKWTEEERLNKIYEYQYSTVMDYGGIFNSDIHGLGKYDYAAMKFGYFKMVDTYADVSKIRSRIDTMAARFGDPSQFSYYLDTSGWRYAGVLFSPFYYLEAYIGVEQNKKRRSASYEQVKLEHEMQTNYDYGELYWTHIEVPYRFCSDEFNGNLGCYVYDMGVDVGETVNNAIAKLDEHYIIDAFKRDSLFKGNFIQTYYNRILSRYMNILGDTGRYLAIYDNIFRRYSWYQDFSQNIYSLGTLAKATRAAFNHLAQLVAAPAPGSFVQDADGIYRNVSYDEVAGADLVVPLGTGKYPYSQFLSGDQYGFENHVVWVGSFWTKLAALVTLTDSTFYSSSDWVGEQLPTGRSTSVGFNTLYARELTNLIGGIISESLDAYSGVVEKDPAGKPLVRPRDLFNPAANAGTAIIEPGLNNLTMKLYAAFNGLVNLGAGFDPSFGDSMAVFLDGNGAEFDLNAGGNGVEVARFADPFGGKTYIAYTPNYDAGRIAPAYAIVKRAQENRDAWDNAAGNVKMELERQLRKDIETLDVLRSFHDIYGSLTY
ncbi:MAG: zinc-dependent metalloprotease, partial [Myxococcales bacterium]|nr:zinc-dependent metalloprotease [Myxococcales bacterium]